MYVHTHTHTNTSYCVNSQTTVWRTIQGCPAQGQLEQGMRVRVEIQPALAPHTVNSGLGFIAASNWSAQSVCLLTFPPPREDIFFIMHEGLNAW